MIKIINKVSFEYARMNSANNSVQLNFSFDEGPNYLENLRLFVEIMKEASEEVEKEIRKLGQKK